MTSTSSFTTTGLAAATACLIAGWLSVAAAHIPPGKRGPILTVNPVYDERTVVAPSRVPDAGLGLFALGKIKEGDVVGELGGQLIESPDLENPSAYMVGLPDCALLLLQPYRYVDSKDHGGHVRRANFAPRSINGTETRLQNARIQQICHVPYVVFVATKDIEPGEEIWVSYGPHYFYERFMYAPAVRDFFCGLIGIDCKERYEFEP